MSIYIRRLRIGSFIKDYVCPPDNEDSFKIYALIINNRNTTYENIKALNSKSDISNARKSYVKFQKNAVSGMPLRELFEGSQYHTGHTFEYKGSVVTIWRLRLVGDIRIYIYYLPSKTIVCLKTIAKRTNDLNDSEKQELEEIVKMVINCSKANLVTVLKD